MNYLITLWMILNILGIMDLFTGVESTEAFSHMPYSLQFYREDDNITLEWNTVLEVLTWCYWQYAVPNTTVWEQFLGYDDQRKERINITSQSRFWSFSDQTSPCQGGIYSVRSGRDREGQYHMMIVALNSTQFKSPNVQVGLNDTTEAETMVAMPQVAVFDGRLALIVFGSIGGLILLALVVLCVLHELKKLSWHITRRRQIVPEIMEMESERGQQMSSNDVWLRREEKDSNWSKEGGDLKSTTSDAKQRLTEDAILDGIHHLMWIMKGREGYCEEERREFHAPSLEGAVQGNMENHKKPLQIRVVAEGLPRPYIRWKKEGVDLKNDTNITIDLAPDCKDRTTMYSVLTLQPNQHCVGTYVCIASNLWGSSERKYEIFA